MQTVSDSKIRDFYEFQPLKRNVTDFRSAVYVIGKSTEKNNGAKTAESHSGAIEVLIAGEN